MNSPEPFDPGVAESRLEFLVGAKCPRREYVDQSEKSPDSPADARQEFSYFARVPPVPPPRATASLEAVRVAALLHPESFRAV